MVDSKGKKTGVILPGKKTGVILPLKRYQRLMEDLHDLAVVTERRAEAPISLTEMKRRLKKNGLL
ncbi:MAG: type II toxin-antitoxin system Phd/YefM family antitoxin [Deltaproteobacteria bacterium]|nr:type II toxin-antitoxin system Phd/YefM family antitoxin [Deltaproteobacteria bacterium]